MGSIFTISIPILFHCYVHATSQQTHAAPELLVRRNWGISIEITGMSWVCRLHRSVRLDKDEGLDKVILYEITAINGLPQYRIGLEWKARVRASFKVGL